MLSPDTRTIAFELMRPPVGYRLDFSVLTTYTLDLEALLILPLSLLASADGCVEELLADPLRLHQAIRDASDRVHVFVDEQGINVPRNARQLYARLESSVHPVRAPGGGTFHPKVWAARFKPTDDGIKGEDRLRVAVLSRNLTYARNWDVALASEAVPRAKRSYAESQPLAELLAELPKLSTLGLATGVAKRTRDLAAQAARCSFAAPLGFNSPVAFHAFGLSSGSSWRPPDAGWRMLAVAPFVSAGGLATVKVQRHTTRKLVSRREELDKLPDEALTDWDAYVLADAASGEPEDAGSDAAADAAESNNNHAPLRGLHAKMIAAEHGWDVTWAVGSANLTGAAFGGSNVEMMATITGKKGQSQGKTGHGIHRFLESGFADLLVPYRRTERTPDDESKVAAEKRLQEASAQLAKAGMRLACRKDGENWTLSLTGAPTMPADIEASVWPVSVAAESHARSLIERPTWPLPLVRLTTFIAFRLRMPDCDVDDVWMSLQLPADGMPGDRTHEILRSLIDSPEKFLRFLQALLGGLEGLANWTQESPADKVDAESWGKGFNAETLLEDLLRTASRDPDRLKPVRRLIDDLRKTNAGGRIVPDDFLDIWAAVEEALATERQP